MMRSVLLAAFALAACTTQPATSGPSLPPPLQRVLDAYTAAWKARDAKALAALFAEGRTIVPNACPPASSRDEVEACYTGSGGALHLRALDHSSSGDLAYIIAEYAERAEDTPGGKFVLTLVKVQGRWLILADMDRPYVSGPQAPIAAP